MPPGRNDEAPTFQQPSRPSISHFEEDVPQWCVYNLDQSTASQAPVHLETREWMQIMLFQGRVYQRNINWINEELFYNSYLNSMLCTLESRQKALPLTDITSCTEGKGGASFDRRQYHCNSCIATLAPECLKKGRKKPWELRRKGRNTSGEQAGS